MRCAANHHEGGSSATRPPHAYEAELAEMNRARTRLFRQLRDAGRDPAEALAAVNAPACLACLGARAAAKPGDRGWCAVCDACWHVDPRTAVTARLPAVRS